MENILLHCTGAQKSFFGGKFDAGLFLTRLGCTGTESSLIDCTHSGIGSHTCDHSRDAGVRCLGMYYTQEQ